MSVGTNIGDRPGNIRKALQLLKKEGIKIDKVSRIIQTKPVGGPPQPKFLNAAISASTDFSPRVLLRKIKKIEKLMGRRKSVRFGPRIIDLDILIFDNLKLKSRDLIIPHPRMWERKFVLKPLRTLLPESEFQALKKLF